MLSIDLLCLFCTKFIWMIVILISVNTLVDVNFLLFTNIFRFDLRHLFKVQIYLLQLYLERSAIIIFSKFNLHESQLLITDNMIEQHSNIFSKVFFKKIHLLWASKFDYCEFFTHHFILVWIKIIYDFLWQAHYVLKIKQIPRYLQFQSQFRNRIIHIVAQCLLNLYNLLQVIIKSKASMIKCLTLRTLLVVNTLGNLI